MPERGNGSVGKLLQIIMAVITAVSVTYAITVRGGSLERAEDAKKSSLQATATAAASLAALADFKIDQAGQHSTLNADIKAINVNIVEIKEMLQKGR